MSELKEMVNNADARDCFKKMAKKAKKAFDYIDGLRKIAKIADRNDGCELTTALLRHSANTKERKKKGEQVTDDE